MPSLLDDEFGPSLSPQTGTSPASAIHTGAADRLVSRLRILELDSDDQAAVPISPAGAVSEHVTLPSRQQLAQQQQLKVTDLSSSALATNPSLASTKVSTAAAVAAVVVGKQWLLPRFVAKTYTTTASLHPAGGGRRGGDVKKDKIFVNIVNLSPYIPASVLSTFSPSSTPPPIVGSGGGGTNAGTVDSETARYEAGSKIQGTSVISSDVDRAGNPSLLVTILVRGVHSRDRDSLDTNLVRRLLNAALAVDGDNDTIGGVSKRVVADDEEFTFPHLKHGVKIKHHLDDIVNIAADDTSTGVAGSSKTSAPAAVAATRSTAPAATRRTAPAATTPPSGANPWRRVENGPEYKTTAMEHPIAAHPLPTAYTHQLVVRLPLRPATTTTSSTEGGQSGSWSVFYDPGDASLKVLVPPMDEFCEVVDVKDSDFRAFARAGLLYVLYRG